MFLVFVVLFVVAIIPLLPGDLHKEEKLESGKEKDLRSSKEIVIAGDLKDTSTKEMFRAIYHRFLPRKVLLPHPHGKDGKAIEKVASFMKE